MNVDDGVASEKRWFALYTKPHGEYVVRGHLLDRGVEAYLPEIRVAVPRRGRRRARPFFPHYLFARLDLGDGLLAKLRWAPGVCNIVSAGDRPLPVPDEVVDIIRRRLATMAAEEPEGPFKRGDVVRVQGGPFEGLDAVFDRRLSPRGRVRVFLDLMNRHVAAELDLVDLMPPY